MGLLTFLYWRHTKPEDDDWYEYVDADDDPQDGPGGGGEIGAAAAASLPVEPVGSPDPRTSPTVDAPTEALDVLAPTGEEPSVIAAPQPERATASGGAAPPTVAIFASTAPAADMPEPTPDEPTGLAPDEPSNQPGSVGTPEEPAIEPAIDPVNVTLDDLRRRAEAAYERQARDLGAGGSPAPKPEGGP